MSFSKCEACFVQAEVRAPAAVRAVDLVDAVWPPDEEPRPQVQTVIFTCELLVPAPARRGHSRRVPCERVPRWCMHCPTTMSSERCSA